jgi:hypothetical protein
MIPRCEQSFWDPDGEARCEAAVADAFEALYPDSVAAGGACSNQRARAGR